MRDLEVTIELPEPHYTLFDAQRNGLPEVIVVNDALLSFQYTNLFRWHLCVTMQATELIENHMPSKRESDLLFEIGDEIESVVLNGRTDRGADNALFLARSTWNETRELMFQVHDPEIAHAALQSLLSSRTWEREWSYRMEDDSMWEKATFVFQLFPQGAPVTPNPSIERTSPGKPGAASHVKR